MKIGYQGMENSNSDSAARLFVERNEKLRCEDVEYIPLVSSKNVVESLLSGKIDYGVLAIKNNVAGEVEETKEALEGAKKIKIIDSLDMKIHHCVFALDKDTKIEAVASHIQALIQTRKNIKRLFGNVQEIEVEDTAIAAKYLREGKLSKNTAVICPKNAGQKYSLTILYENIEDNADNVTTFILVNR